MSSVAGAQSKATKAKKSGAQPSPIQAPPVADRTSGGRPVLDELSALRLELQQRSSRNMRQHLIRAVRRLTVLVASDLGAFWLMRAALRAVRDAEVLGPWYAAQVREVLPRGVMNGWSYATALLVALLVTGNYGAGDERRSPGRLFAAASLATALPLWSSIWLRGADLVALQFGLVALLVWVALVVERFAVDRIVGRYTHTGVNSSPTLFVGLASECRRIMASPAFAAGNEYQRVGFVDLASPKAEDALGRADEFARVLAESHSQSVVFCGFLPDHWFREIVDLALAAGCHVMSVPRAVDVAGVEPTLVWRESQLLIELVRPTLKGWQLFLKRLMDVVGSTLLLVVLSPVFALAAAAVRLESQGSVFFRQRRLGLNGKVFGCIKFRSMRADAEARLNADSALHAEYVANNFKLPAERDPRLTKVGRLLRATSLDELPQLLNVLRGEMSLVGPRPIVPEELDQYGHGAPLFLSLKPGLTGAWQVRGRSRVGYPDRAAIELDYVRNWSLASDLSILLRTVPVVLLRSGAH